MIHFGGEMDNEIIDFLMTTFVFKNISSQTVKKLLENSSLEICEYHPKETVFTHNDYKRKLGFILEGECVVEHIKNDGNAVPLNSLKAGNSFGAVAVFSSADEFPTWIIAKKKSRIVFISKQDIHNMISYCPEISLNIITFLSDKINFLNQKIATFSSDSVEEKLASYILTECKKTGSTELDFNAKKTAEAINAGRASIYRALISMSDNGIIFHDNKKIIIKDLQGLERIKK